VSGALPVPSDLQDALNADAHRLGPFGVHVVHFASTDSTNNVAGRLANAGAPEGTIVVADAQTAGRGRMGHSWFSPPRAGLYTSVVLRPRAGSVPVASDAAGVLALMAGVAVADGVRAASGIDAALKWPNDVVIPGVRPRGQTPGSDPHGSGGRDPRKIAGILAEGSMVSGTLLHVVLGIGVNLARAAYPPELALRATSIEEETGHTVERSRVLVEVLAALAGEYAALATGDVRGVLARWRARSPSSSGAPIAWASADGPKRGVTAGIDDTGALLARTPAGSEVVRAGTVTWL
jgi:BirA family biotin operon repressor/biotin-[acetyl-CoA-carboxylase] ligase